MAFSGEPIEKLLELLKSPEDRVRYRTKIELGGRDSSQVIAATDRWVAALDKNDPEYAHHLLEALWVHQYHNAVNVDILRDVLASSDFRARAAAARNRRGFHRRRLLKSERELQRAAEVCYIVVEHILVRVAMRERADRADGAPVGHLISRRA